MLLTFEIKVPDVVHIHTDDEGLDKLIKDLTRLRDAGDKSDHTHLFTEAWGGHDLTEDRKIGGTELVHHVKICKW